jgi:hypothetical protein
MTFPLTIADEDISHIEEHLARRVVLIREGDPELLWQDRVFAMLLGGAKQHGFGKKKRVIKAGP